MERHESSDVSDMSELIFHLHLWPVDQIDPGERRPAPLRRRLFAALLPGQVQKGEQMRRGALDLPHGQGKKMLSTSTFF